MSAFLNRQVNTSQFFSDVFDGHTNSSAPVLRTPPSGSLLAEIQTDCIRISSVVSNLNSKVLFLCNIYRKVTSFQISHKTRFPIWFWKVSQPRALMYIFLRWSLYLQSIWAVFPLPRKANSPPVECKQEPTKSNTLPRSGGAQAKRALFERMNSDPVKFVPMKHTQQSMKLICFCLFLPQQRLYCRLALKMFHAWLISRH